MTQSIWDDTSGLAEYVRRARPRVVCEGRIHAPSWRAGARLISMIIPVKNGGEDLQELLQRVLSQQRQDSIEIIAIDSGSTDSTVGALRHAGASVVSIDPGSFNHGMTRNLAAHYARGEIFIFMTQRAQPANDQWLSNLIAPLDADPRIAGAYSRTLPRADADFLTFREYLEWEGRPEVREIADPATYSSLSPSELNRFIRFSNVSNAIRPEVFARFPFRDTHICEDRLWAKDVLEAGYKIRYESSSMVFHSHNLSHSEHLRRSFDFGLGAHAVVGLCVDASELLATIVGPIRDDWHYLEQRCQGDAVELEQWQIAAVLRRTAQSIGFWLGTNYHRLSGDLRSLLAAVAQGSLGTFPLAARPYIDGLLANYGQGREGRIQRETHRDDGTVIARLTIGIRTAWDQLNYPRQGDADELELERLATALRQVAQIVGTWLGANERQGFEDLRSLLSQIERIKAGALIQKAEFDGPRVTIDSARRSGLSTDPHQLLPSRIDTTWQADLTALYSNLDGLHAEMLALRSELHAQVQRGNCIIDNLRSEMFAKVNERDQIIRDLQAELHAKVGERDQTIRGLQRELHEKVGERDQTIRDLQSELEHKVGSRDENIGTLRARLSGDQV